jgi:hypothetical protein
MASKFDPANIKFFKADDDEYPDFYVSQDQIDNIV